MPGLLLHAQLQPKAGSLEALSWLHSAGCSIDLAACAQAAADNGKPHILEWLRHQVPQSSATPDLEEEDGQQRACFMVLWLQPMLRPCVQSEDSPHHDFCISSKRPQETDILSASEVPEPPLSACKKDSVLEVQLPKQLRQICLSGYQGLTPLSPNTMEAACYKACRDDDLLELQFLFACEPMDNILVCSCAVYAAQLGRLAIVDWLRKDSPELFAGDLIPLYAVMHGTPRALKAVLVPGPALCCKRAHSCGRHPRWTAGYGTASVSCNHKG